MRIGLWPRRRSHRADRVCVYRVGAIGDIVCAIPALRSIRRAYPDAHLTLLTTPGRYSHSRHAEELLGGVQWIDEIILYDLDDIKSREQRRAFGAKLRARRFDAWFDLTLDRTRFIRMLRDMIFARLIGARWAYGWRLEHLDFAAKAEAEFTEFPNEVERLAGVLSRCGIESPQMEFALPAKEIEDPSVRRILRECEASSIPMVAIAPGARRSCNLWPSERFAAVAIDLISRGVIIVLIGGPDDHLMCEDLASRIGPEATNLAGELSLSESCALLRRCDLLICVDSGPQQLAAAVGTPCVALFSQRNQRRRWYPYGSDHIVLEGSVECHTCLLDTCPNDNRCMKQISIEDVLSAAHDKLGTKLDRSQGDARTSRIQRYRRVTDTQTVSIIVAVLNRAATLQQCLDSVSQQTHRALELIVFDGGSNDGSREILETNSAKITHWQSGPDRGIPHTWNMGLARATGDWICFLGADDQFATSTAIAKLLRASHDPMINYVSGQAALIDDDGRVRRIIGTRWNWQRMKRYQHIAHPGSIHRRDLFERYGNFDERYPIAFDYEFLLRAGRAIHAEFIAEPITLMGNAGQSNAQARRAFRENRRIHALHPEIGIVGAAINQAVASAKHLARIASPRLVASARNHL